MDTSKWKEFGDRMRVNVMKSIDPNIRSVDKFQRAWDNIMADCKREMNLTRHVNETDIPASLDIMVTLLVKEQAITEVGVNAGGCTELFLNTDMLGHLIRVSEADVPLRFRAEVNHFITQLIGLMDGQFLVQNAVHRPVLYLLRRALEREPEYDDQMIELSYSIASKIHEYPELLKVFFIENYYPKNVTKESVAVGKAMVPHSPYRPLVNKTDRDYENVNDVGKRKSTLIGLSRKVPGANGGELDFLLWDYLMRSIHLQGGPDDSEARCGDWARAGCLFLLELIEPETDMETYILSTDFSNLIVAGLGGLFSQLPNVLPEGYDQIVKRDEKKNFAVMSFKNELCAFLNMTKFIQDVIINCPSENIRTTLINDVKISFLDTILASCIQNSHDFDASSVAVLFYIREMMKTITESQDLSRLMCNFLLNGEDEDECLNDSNIIDTEIKLHIRDILVTKLNAISEHVVIAVLNLFQTLLSMHSINSLRLIIDSLNQKKAGTNISKIDRSHPIRVDIQQHRALVDRYVALLPPEDPNLGREHSLEAYIQDVYNLHPQDIVTEPEVYVEQTSPTSSSPDKKIFLEPTSEIVKTQLRLIGRDSTLRKFLSIFATFFSHSFQVNLALTGVLSLLASEPEPLLYLYLFSAEMYLKTDHTAPANQSEEGSNYGPDETEHQSLYSTILKLRTEIQRKRNLSSDFDIQLVKTRERMFGKRSQSDLSHGLPVVGDERGIVGRASSTRGLAGLFGKPERQGETVDEGFLKNIVLLEEAVKELLAVILMHGSRGYDQISYFNKYLPKSPLNRSMASQTSIENELIDEKLVLLDIIRRIGSRTEEFIILHGRVEEQTESLRELEERLQKLRYFSKDYAEQIAKKKSELAELERRQYESVFKGSRVTKKILFKPSEILLEEKRTAMRYIKQLELLLNDTKRQTNHYVRIKESHEHEIRELEQFLDFIFGNALNDDDDDDDGSVTNVPIGQEAVNAPQEALLVQKQQDARDELLRVVAEIDSIQSLGELLERAIQENNLGMDLLSNLTRGEAAAAYVVVGNKYFHIEQTIMKTKKHVGTLLLAIQMLDNHIDSVAEHVSGARVDQAAQLTLQLIQFKSNPWLIHLTTFMKSGRQVDIQRTLEILKESQKEMLGPLMRLGKLQQIAITDCLEVSELKYLQARQDVTSLRTQLVLNAILFSSTHEYQELTSQNLHRHYKNRHLQHQNTHQWQDQQWTSPIHNNTFQGSKLNPIDISVIERSENLQHPSDDHYDSSHTSLLSPTNINGARKKRNKLRSMSYHNKSFLSSGSGEGQTFTSDVRERLRSITMSTVGSTTLSRRSSRGSKNDLLDFYVSMYAEQNQNNHE
ncbi:hypothetical protein HK096_009454 [Nowakowskiella sp. JEL0078]|nr:hypothetical protein HK096_009454 [Nowakowskiella sp. JEL0078]